MLGLGTNAHSNGNGIAIPDYKENHLRVIREILKKLLDEYKKYRFLK